MLNLNALYFPVKCLMAVAVSVLFSCTMQKSTQATLNQGIEGAIYKISGNQMPMKGAESSKPKRLVCEVYIYQATTAKQAQGQGTLYSQISTKLVAKVKTDSTGHYQAELPAGLYSVFVKEGKQYFASESDGTGTLNPAVVATNKVTTRNITVNFDAAY
jgi:hypothetical protein